MIYVLVLVTFYYTDGIHEEGSICQVREEDFDARFMKKLKSPWENIYSKTEVDELLNAKQNTLIEGTGIDIDEDDEISCTVEPSTVTVTQVQTTGTKIATIDVDGVDTDIYAPEGGSGGLAEDVIADEFDTTPIVTPGQSYSKYDIVKKDSHYYWAKQTTSTSWVASEWTDAGTSITDVAPSGTWDQVQVAGGGIVHDTKISKYVINTAQWSNGWSEGIGEQDPFKYGNYQGNYQGGSTSYHQYSAGDFCMHEGGLYKCTGSTTGQSWNSSKWSATQVTDELSGSGSTVSVTQVVSTGTKIATITVDGNGTDLYAPAGGGGGGATIIEVWDTKENTPDPTPALAESLAALQRNHSYCYFKVNGANKTATEVKALLEAGFCVLKTSAEIATVLACESLHGYVFAQSYGQNLPSNYAFTYTSSYKWMTQ